MKGKLFVILYSLFLLGLFGVCCYLMTIVNPEKLPGNVTRRFHPANDIYDEVSLPPRDNPNYGLEKIPEGVDADEYRKQYMKSDVKFDFIKDERSYENGQRVVPPIWPSDEDDERNIEKRKNKESNPKEFEPASPVKGHRRSINNNKERPGSILLKILDDEGNKKIEIKFLSNEKIKSNKLRRNRSSNQIKSNITLREILNADENKQNKQNDETDNKVIVMKTNDVILLQFVDDPNALEDKNILLNANNTDVMQEIVLNITNLNYLNKKFDNKTILDDPVDAKKVTDSVNYNMYTLSLLLDGGNSTVDSIYDSQEHSSEPSIASKALGNDQTSR